MHPARRRLVFLSAALAAVLAVLVPVTAASAAAAPAAGTRGGASHPQTILTVGHSAAVFPGQGQEEATLQPHLAVGACVAAEDATTALEQGAAKVPEDWGPGIANKKGVGIRWTDPANQGNGIRIDQGVPDSLWPYQQVDHVVVRSGGKILGRDGKPIVGSLQENPEAHIPLSDWLNWASWNTP